MRAHRSFGLLPGWWCDARLGMRSIRAVRDRALAVDVETTGLDRAHDALREIAVVRVCDGAVLHCWDAKASAHPPSEAAAMAWEVVRGSPIVMHHAWFDLAFLRRAHSGWRQVAAAGWLCTWRAFGSGPALHVLATRVHQRWAGRHTAVGDARTLAAILRSAWSRAAEAPVGSARAWSPHVRPTTDAAALEAAVVRSFPNIVPLRLPTPHQRAALRALQNTATQPFVDPVAMADTVDDAARTGLARGHVERLFSRGGAFGMSAEAEQR